jgi:uncharacterized protein
MDRESPFSYQCFQCGLCCHDKVITLSPYDVLRIARAVGVSTAEAVRRFTMRRGSLLRVRLDGGCVALEEARCTIHRGRPLVCRLYPLGIERTDTDDPLIRLEPAPGSLGVFGTEQTASLFLEAQGTRGYFEALDVYRALVPLFRARVGAIVDFERVEPREFWRQAVAEALLETGFDPNRLIDAILDPDGLGCGRETAEATVEAHATVLAAMASLERDAECLGAAAVMLAVSLSYGPGDVIVGRA